ncbi:T9SS type A sorting domain-containing protein [uncultured Winogradskyella sp.]|uniref:T9SS type A sorting domain-containing protein n=1 Tax=uncultured Winogradskyella sp. TaxID=395353 RepID=UPI00261B25B9|nr:T9SS type A sorting domain-containing protein [uncultured Winogradskyella sp.]
MKGILLTVFLCFNSILLCQTTAIPDSNFEQALIDLGIDSNGLNGNILNSDAQAVTVLDLEGSCNCDGIDNMTGIEAFINLTSLTAGLNSFSNIDLSSNILLEYVSIAFGSLTSINLSQNTNLIELRLSYNALQDLDLSNVTSLEIFGGFSCGVSAIDFSQNLALEKLYFSENDITELDLTQNINLTDVYLNDCSLESLDVRNGTNTNITNFRVLNNPNLTCIQVDDAVYSSTNWTNIDSQTSFSEDCDNLSINEYKESFAKIFPNPANDKVYINIKNNSNYILMDIQGKYINKGQLYTGTNNLKIANLVEGIYFLKISSGNISTTKKIIKKVN